MHVRSTLALLASVCLTVSATVASAQSPLAGSSWQLVRFQGGDGTVLTPDDGGKYTIAFDARGNGMAMRIDCNRGRGTWKSAGANQIEFGHMAVTRALCLDSNLHDQILKQWGNIRSYAIRDGHLFLSLMADGGTYEFEPMNGSPTRSRRQR
jgi:para-nitrobenzyl esterase